MMENDVIHEDTLTQVTETVVGVLFNKLYDKCLGEK